MDLDEFRSFISDSGVDIWTWIDLAVSIASSDHHNELKIRRDGIIQKLYSSPFSNSCTSCHDPTTDQTITNSSVTNQEMGLAKRASQSLHDDDDEDDGGEQKKKILEIKIILEDDQNQGERGLIELLKRLVDMDTTFKALKETDIGRHVMKLRKHSSHEVRRLVKILVRKWKDIVDEWVRLNTPMEEEEEDQATQFNDDRNSVNEGHHEREKAQVAHHTDSQKRKLRHNQIDQSDGKHLHDLNHQETQHAKKQMTTSQAMAFHDIPKLKNSIVSHNKGSVQVKYW